MLLNFNLRNVSSQFFLLQIVLILFLLGCSNGSGSKPTPPVVTLSSIAISPTSSSIIAGETASLTATGEYSDGSISTITTQATWSSSAVSTATVGTNTGVVAGVGVGTTTVAATFEGISSTPAYISVTAATLSSISISPAVSSLSKGATTDIVATGTYSDGTTGNISGSVSWNSSAPDALTVNVSGIATGVGAGASLITATLNGKTSNTVTVNVTDTLKGVLTGLTAGNSITLVNGVDTLTLSDDGSFTFPTQLAAGSAYNMSIATAPANQPCTFTYGTGTVTSITPEVKVICGIPRRSNTVLLYNSPMPYASYSLTELSNSKVLLVGGFTTNSYTASSQTMLFDPKDDTWVDTGRVLSSRHSHTATLLPDGRIMLAGGCGATPVAGTIDPSVCTTPLISAELYDPATKTSVAVANMLVGFSGHTDVVLNSGKILFVDLHSHSSQLFDPVANAWSTPTSATWTFQTQDTPRAYQKVVKLPSGKVLVIGPPDYGITAEVYDPSTNAWTATGAVPLTLGSVVTAELLANGKVFVAGTNWNAALGTDVVLYNPATNTWAAAAAPLTTLQVNATFTLLPNGNILMSGGETTANGTAIADCELYDPATNTWTAASPMTVLRLGHFATPLPSGKVMVLGGTGGAINIGGITTFSTNLADTYDPATNTWTSMQLSAGVDSTVPRVFMQNGTILMLSTTNAMNVNSTVLFLPDAGRWTANAPVPSSSGTALIGSYHLLPNGKIFGSGLFPPYNDQLYDPSANTWASTGSGRPSSFGSFIYDTSVLLKDGKLLFYGHDAGVGIYDPTTNSWRRGAFPVTGRTRPTTVLLPNGKVLFFGGLAGLASTALDTELYDPTTDTWSSVGTNSYTGGYQQTATILPSGKVLIMGGQHFLSGAPMAWSYAQTFDPATNTWASVANMPASLAYHTATLLPSGKVLVAGGADTISTTNPVWIYSRSAYLYDPSTDTWTTAGSMRTARKGHAATLMPDGNVIVSGGLAPSMYGTVENGVEMYNPTTNSWTVLSGVRDNISSISFSSEILLPNGKLFNLENSYW